jgi:hypothetical protein
VTIVTARAYLAVAGFAAVGFGGAARAQSRPESRPSPVVVDVAPPAGSPAWFAASVELMVERELGRFHGVSHADKLDPARCPDRHPDCLVAAYRAAGVDVMILGTLHPDALHYEVYDAFSGHRDYGGKLPLSGGTSEALQRRVADLVRPIVQRGGLVDELSMMRAQAAPVHAAPLASPILPARSKAPAPAPAELPTPTGRDPVPWLMLGLILFIAFPPLLARLLVRSRELRRRQAPTSWTWSAVVAVTLGLILLASLFADVRGALAALAAPTTRSAQLLVPLGAGMLWGSFFIVNFGWVFAPIHGLGQIRHDVLWPLLRAWLLLCLMRAVLLGLYVLPLWLALRACAAIPLPDFLTYGLALPAVGLLVYFWLLTLVDNLSLFLDVAMVIGPATPRNPWHGTIKRYFRGYLRRNGVELDPHLLERTLFLPAVLPNVISYGGGFAPPRILVGEQPRDAALGGLPDEDEFPERTVNPEELPLGFVVPALGESVDDATRLQRERAAETRRVALTAAAPRKRNPPPRLVGESATLLGWVLPQGGGEGVPLISNDSDDFDVVKRLLTEHYAAFERGLDDDEVDDTDPSQKDFLFGALIREMGALGRRDSFVATLGYSIMIASSRITRALVRPPIAFYERFLSLPAARVADAYAALNAGLHHLIQYLAFLRNHDDAPLTARANQPVLMRASRDQLERLGRDRLSTEERQPLRATPRNRLVWLSQFYHAPFAPVSDRSLRVAGAVVFFLVAGVILLFAVNNALEYHPKWLERTRSTQGAASDVRPAAPQ